jgi:hypothetical protein
MTARRPDEIFEELIGALNFNAESPQWTPELVELHRLARVRKLLILPEHYYTPVFSPASLPESVWSSRFDSGVDYDVARQLSFLSSVLRFNSELSNFGLEPAGDENDTDQYLWKNTQFSHFDAVLYYSMIRHLEPKRVVEIGGGFSTLLASAAVRRNGSTRIRCVEPYPRPFLERGLQRVDLIRQAVDAVPLALFDELEEGDILFYDGTHISKTGSDVNHVLLRIFPLLRKGVWIHVHDIYLPFEYPRAWSDEHLLYWNEQYVLAALISNSRKFEVVAGSYFLQRTAQAELQKMMPDIPGVYPGGASFWMRVRK